MTDSPELNPTARFFLHPYGYAIIPIVSRRLGCVLLSQSLSYQLIGRADNWDRTSPGETIPPAGCPLITGHHAQEDSSL